MSGRNRCVLDASAVLALIQDEPGAKRLWAVAPDAVVGAVNLAEVLAKLVGRGMPREEAVAAVDALHLEVAGFGPDEAVISAAYVRKGVSLGDRCFLASAYVRGAGWTSDRTLASIESPQLPRIEFFR